MSAWTDFREVPQLPRFSLRIWQELLDGGQSFRWNRVPSHGDCVTWQGLWARHAARIRISNDGACAVSFLQLHGASFSDSVAALQSYLGQSTDWVAVDNALPWRSDKALAVAMAQFQGLRLLKQPFGEALLGFLCSSTKQIPQIKLICEQLAARFGEALGEGLHTLPDWPRLANVSESALRECGLGYRAKYIAGTAACLAAQPDLLRQMETLPYAEAKALLLQLPGVGEKIADCVLLFGAGRFEAFPVDTWMLKIMATAYGLADWSPQQVAHFGRIHFGPYAGLAQQYLFSSVRMEQSRPSI